MTATTFRHDDLIIKVETKSAIIDFQDILDSAEVVPDEHNFDAPWDNCDGWEHTATPVRRFNAPQEDCEDAQGYCWSHGDHTRVMIQVKEDYGLYKYMRDRGASKQVASEAVAAQKRRIIAQLVEWYKNGWEWWGVQCEYEGFEDSIWGIDDPAYAETLREEVAREVAHQLEEKGYTITNKPQPVKTAYRHSSLAEQNWKD